MQFNTIEFFVFFAICFLVYYRVSEKKSKWFLLGFSLIFYSFFSYSAAIVLLLIALLSWFGELVLVKRGSVFFVWVFSALTLAPLVLLKYLDAIPGYALPIGLSFFSLQAVSGMVDVYRKKTEKTGFGEHFLYLSFFPTIVSGPIIRKNDFLKEINKPKVFIYENVRRGCYRIAIGFIEKYLLADRLSRLVDYVYGHPGEVGGAQIVVATILFGLQLYYDFAGYSHMAIGFAKCFGISIMENFERPYFSCSIKEFWRRWHISLSSWLRDYVYIPLGGSRKGTWRKYGNLIATFLVSGIWHGVGLNYLFWGLLHGIYQVVEDGLVRKAKKTSIEKKEADGIIKKSMVPLLSMTGVLIAVNFAWIFFRAADMATAIQMVKTLLTDFRISALFTRWWFEYGMSKLEYIMWAMAALGIFFFDVMEEWDAEFLDKFEKQKTWIRWSVYVVLVFIILTILLSGVGRDTKSFLYQNF